MNQRPCGRPAKVYLVGAGPGDPRLITLRGVECLAKADLVLYDGLVNPALLDYAPPSAELICPGLCGVQDTGQRMSQEQINARMIDAVRQGKTVVRLKGGDPDVFGRSDEETAALTAANIPWESVPGVTAALAAASYAGIPITHGRHCSAVALVTGQERSHKASPLDYGKLADFPGTLIFYMGVVSAEAWTKALISRGKPPETPAAIVRRCSWPDQETIRCTLASVARVIAERELRPPAVIVVGEVVSLAAEVSWFAARVLFGRRILVTRPRQQAGTLGRLLEELGADVMYHPAIRITDPPDWAPVDAALDRLDRYHWLVFSSVNGVRYLLERLCAGDGDLRRLGRVKLAAIGPATADELRRYRLQVDLLPEEYQAEAMADALIRQEWGNVAGETAVRRFLLVRASRGREVLAERLVDAGGEVDQIVVYSSTDTDRVETEVADALAAGRIDWITVTSSAIARSLAALFGQQLRQSKLASISPITSEVLRQLGHEPSVEAEHYTMEGLVEAIVAARDVAGR